MIEGRICRVYCPHKACIVAITNSAFICVVWATTRVIDTKLILRLLSGQNMLCITSTEPSYDLICSLKSNTSLESLEVMHIMCALSMGILCVLSLWAYYVCSLYGQIMCALSMGILCVLSLWAYYVCSLYGRLSGLFRALSCIRNIPRICICLSSVCALSHRMWMSKRTLWGWPILLPGISTVYPHHSIHAPKFRELNTALQNHTCFRFSKGEEFTGLIRMII